MSSVFMYRGNNRNGTTMLRFPVLLEGVEKLVSPVFPNPMSHPRLLSLDCAAMVGV